MRTSTPRCRKRCLTPCDWRMVAAPASSRSVQARSPSPLPGCWTDAPPRPIGCGPTSYSVATPGRGAAQPSVHRRRRHPHLRGHDDRHRSVPPPHPTRPRRRRGQLGGTDRLVAPPQRQGGQAQFVERLRAEVTGDQLGPLRDWMLENCPSARPRHARGARPHVSTRSLVGSARRPGSLRWPGSPMRGSTSRACC